VSAVAEHEILCDRVLRTEQALSYFRAEWTATQVRHGIELANLAEAEARYASELEVLVAQLPLVEAAAKLERSESARLLVAAELHELEEVDREEQARVARIEHLRSELHELTDAGGVS
jgi:hypothetical protein